MTASEPDALVAVLTESQRLGFLGARPVTEVVAHARSFVGALSELPAGSRIIDLGAGGGVPGLVIAHDRPDLEVHLLDRRTKRTDFLERVVRRLGWSDRVLVVARDVEDHLADTPEAFDAVVARGFGPPDITLATAVRLVRPGGVIVISEPPEGDRWAPALLARLGVERVAVERFSADRAVVPKPSASAVAVFRRNP